MASKHCIPILILYTLISAVDCDRKLSAQLNPGCDDPSCKTNDAILFHVKAEGENDTLHHLWDFTPTKKPSFLLLLTEKNSSVSVKWPSFKLGQAGAVTIDSTPKYAYGTVIDKVIEFNDEGDNGSLNQTINNSSYVSLLDTRNCAWQVVNISNTTTSDYISLTIESNSYLDSQTRAKKNGTIRVVMTAFAKQGHAETLPHLMHTDNATQMDITLENLARQYTNTRFGLRMIAFSSDNPNTTVEIKPRKTMDDEHAPGVFSIVEIVTANGDTNLAPGGGFLQWRPVVYTSATRDMTLSTETISYSIVVSNDTVRALDKTLPFSVFGSKLSDMLVVATNVTFGIAGDGFYRKGNYAEWSVMMGYGQPPEETFSMLVALVLLIGLGLPAVVILTGTVCIVLRRLQRNKDDLFLSR